MTKNRMGKVCTFVAFKRATIFCLHITLQHLNTNSCTYFYLRIYFLFEIYRKQTLLNTFHIKINSQKEYLSTLCGNAHEETRCFHAVIHRVKNLQT